MTARALHGLRECRAQGRAPGRDLLPDVRRAAKKRRKNAEKLGKTWENYEQIWGNDGKTVGRYGETMKKLWENCRKNCWETMGRPENLGEEMRKYVNQKIHENM